MRERAQSFDPRQVMRGDKFEVFHYREPSPGAVEVHHHDFYEVYFLLGGQVEYWVEGRILRLTKGDILLINPMELHRPIVQPESPVYERIVLWINREFLENLVTKDGPLSRCFDLDLPNRICPGARERSVLTARMSDLVREYYSRDYGSDLCAQGLFLQLMAQLNRLVLREEGSDLPQQQFSPLVQKALQYIGNNIGSSLSLDEIAGACFVSKYHLAHTFGKEMGLSVYRYIMLRRLLLARHMLLSGEPAGQVSTACGFSDYTSFYRAFRAEYGVSPRDFAAGQHIQYSI